MADANFMQVLPSFVVYWAADGQEHSLRVSQGQLVNLVETLMFNNVSWFRAEREGLQLAA